MPAKLHLQLCMRGVVELNMEDFGTVVDICLGDYYQFCGRGLEGDGLLDYQQPFLVDSALPQVGSQVSSSLDFW